MRSELIEQALRNAAATTVIEALAMARDQGRLAGAGAIFRSDRGSPYTSSQFQQWCVGNSVPQSMGKVGVCWACQVGPRLPLAQRGPLQ